MVFSYTYSIPSHPVNGTHSSALVVPYSALDNTVKLTFVSPLITALNPKPQTFRAVPGHCGQSRLEEVSLRGLGFDSRESEVEGG